jgi:integrase
MEAVEYRLGLFFSGAGNGGVPWNDVPLGSVTPKMGAELYEVVRTRPTYKDTPMSVDTHRTVLAAAKSFLKWCVGKKWLSSNPLDGVEGVGRRRHGKEQLRIDEARKWLAKATERANAGEEGAVAAMLALLLGMRATEIISRVVRDLDDEGRLLWIPETKTAAGRRTLQVPELVRGHLREIAKGKRPQELLFGYHWRDWPREWVQRICREAGVPEITAHGMRGLHSTLAVDSGITGHAVAAALGHESFEKTTAESYVQPGAIANAQQRQVLKVLSGGRN